MPSLHFPQGRGCRRLHAVDPTCIAILVRSDAARKSLRSRWRKQAIDGLILTPAEAKGLEFDMVILALWWHWPRKPEKPTGAEVGNTYFEEPAEILRSLLWNAG